MKQRLRRGLATLGYRVQGTRYIPRQLQDPACVRALEFDDVICRRMIEIGRPLTFLQIGAFDGVTRDPLHKYIAAHGWQGVLVEPQPAAAAALRSLYAGNDHVAIVQAAIDDTARSRTLYSVKAGAGPAWAGGLASFDRASILKHAPLVPGLEQMIEETAVDCLTFDALADQLPSPDLDLLQIDAEGADLRLLEIFPFHRMTPAIVHWEIKHATTSEREACFERLLNRGYRLALSGGEDMLAVRA